MNKYVLSLLFCIIIFATFAQTPLKVKNDSVIVTNADLIIRNGTKNMLGFLSNTGDGLANWSYPSFLLGGTTPTSTITYQTTSGIGTTGADHIFKVGNNGATEAMRIRNDGNIGIGTSPSYKLDVLGTSRFVGQHMIKGTVASDAASLGAELTTVGTMDASWSGTSFATGYTHTNGSITSITTTLAPVVNSFYQLTFTLTNNTTGSISISFGGVTISGINTSYHSAPQALSNSTLTITPTSTFNGTVVLSVRLIGTSTATVLFQNSANVATNEIRASTNPSNCFVGMNAGYKNTTGNGLTAIGSNAMLSNTSGLNNTAVGNLALVSNNTGTSNTAVGGSTLQLNTTGGGNTAVGYLAGERNTTGGQNSSFGNAALRFTTTGNHNSALGVSAGFYNTTGNLNIAIGYASFFNNTTGSQNTVIGGFAGITNITDGSNNQVMNNTTLLGYNTKTLNNNETNQMVLGFQAIGLGSNSSVIGNNTTTKTGIWGRTLIGLTLPTDNNVDALQVNGSAVTTQYKLSALNTAPSSSTAAGTAGEIRVCADAIYVCTATNTWVKTTLVSF
ncbi:MAG: hypothetical protein V4717_21160 [Bacteroidota bacterium]